MTARAEDTPADTGCGRPLRRDAERNRQRILEAAAEVFTQRGLDATLDDVARQAGVGVGTVYRRFPDKETLVAELFQDRIDTLVAVAEQARTAPDPWQGLMSFLQFAAASMADDLGLRQLMMFATYGKDKVAYAREQMRPAVSKLVERAQAAGALRPDFDATDVPLVCYMLAAAAEYASPVHPDVWQRYLTLLIDSLPPSRENTSELPVPALTPEEMEDCMRAHGQRTSTRR